MATLISDEDAALYPHVLLGFFHTRLTRDTLAQSVDPNFKSARVIVVHLSFVVSNGKRREK